MRLMDPEFWDKSRRKLYENAARMVLPEERLSVVDWAEKNVVIPSRSSYRSGPFRVSTTPYARKLLEFFADPNLREMTSVKSAQFGKTTILNTGLLYCIDQAPGPMLWVMAKEQQAESFKKDRLNEFIAMCPKVKAEILPGRGNDNTSEIRFRRMTLSIVGGQSPTDLSSRPIRYLLGDEVDKWKGATNSEASGWSLARERVETYPNHKIVGTSTPTTPEGQIWQSWLSSWQHIYVVPCPLCGEYQPLRFWKKSRIDYSESGYRLGKLIFDDDARLPDGNYDGEIVKRSARYECGYCYKSFNDHQRLKVIPHGKWVPLVQGATPSAHIGYQASRLYSTMSTMGSIAQNFVSCYRNGRFDPELLHGFINSTLAEPFEYTQTKVRSHGLETQMLDYPRGKVPEGCMALVCSVDVQEDRCYFIVRSWGACCRSWLIDWGDIARGEGGSLEPLYQLFHRRFETVDGRSLSITKGMIDSGYNAAEVYDFCDRINRGTDWVMPTKGSKEDTNKQYGAQRMMYGGQRRAKDYYGDQDGGLWIITKGLAMDRLYGLLLQAPKGADNFWAVPESVTADYVAAINSYEKVKDERKQNDKGKWISRSKQFEHFADCEAMQAAYSEHFRSEFFAGNARVDATIVGSFKR